MASEGGRRGIGPGRSACAAVWLLLTGCSILPSELNLSPLYRHRLDQHGELLELDVLWPVFHYEATSDGGTDFRIRPVYRYVTYPTQEHMRLPATETQFLWPLGRVRSDGEQTRNRLFPLWSYTSRLNSAGQRETDWYVLFPFFWGGTRDDGNENYFGFFPVGGDLPDFLTYERFRFFLFPLHLGLQKNRQVSQLYLWPLTGFGRGPKGDYWHRFLPFYSVDVAPSFRRYSVLWPFFHWGVENLDTEHPIWHFMFWPPYGRRWGDTASGWAVLWPFFQEMTVEGRMHKLDILWPIFRYLDQYSGTERIWQWWFWPLVARTVVVGKQSAWVFLWPLIWWREYHDPEGKQSQQWVAPFYWHVSRDRASGEDEDFVHVWPFYERAEEADGNVEWSVLSPVPWRKGNVYGVKEAYGWIWTLAEGKQRGPDDRSMELMASLYTTRKRHGRRQTSVPFLFNYESQDDGSGVLRLFQFIPIPWGGPTSAR